MSVQFWQGVPNLKRKRSLLKISEVIIMKENILKSMKIVARITSALVLLIFLVFFIGENTVNNIALLKTQDILLLLLIPGVLTIGTIITWKNELLGGIVICAVFTIFSVIDYAVTGKIVSPNFLIIFVTGILFIIVGINSKKQTHKQAK